MTTSRHLINFDACKLKSDSHSPGARGAEVGIEFWPGLDHNEDQGWETARIIYAISIFSIYSSRHLVFSITRILLMLLLLTSLAGLLVNFTQILMRALTIYCQTHFITL